MRGCFDLRVVVESRWSRIASLRVFQRYMAEVVRKVVLSGDSQGSIRPRLGMWDEGVKFGSETAGTIGMC